MLQLNHRLSVYIPPHLLRNTAVALQVDAITKQTGGCTLSEGRGAWVNSEGTVIMDRMTVVQWWWSGAAELHAAALRSLVKSLFLLGEECVMVERNSVAFILYPGDIR